MWAGIWIFQAIIWLFPFNRTTNAVTNQMTDTANGEPGWYAHLLNSFGHAFVGAGVWVAVILAALSMVIGLGPLISKRPGPYIGLGIALALLYWVTGEGVGELLTFSGTDPNNGPLLALIGFSVLPTVPEPASEPTLAARFLATNPLGALSTLLAIVLIPSAVAIIPALDGCIGFSPAVARRRSQACPCRDQARHEGDVDNADDNAFDKGRPRSPHGHGGHGGSRRDRSTLEVHRPSIASRSRWPS